LIKKESELSVRKQCQLLHLNRSSVYYDPKETTEEERRHREELMGQLDVLYTKYPTYGTRKLVILMQKEGYEIGRKLVRRLMQEMGLYTIYPKENLSKRNFKEAIVPYLLRNRLIRFPNEVWSVDITYIKLYGTHMYLTAIIDWYSRKIMGWKLSDTLDTAAVLEAVKEAVDKYGAPAIVNSDQGTQFTSTEYKALLKRLQIRQSMDGKSRWADNIMIERWFRSLKTDLIYINEFHSPRELRQAIEKYVTEYNTVRPHQSLGNETPEAVFQTCFQIGA
jgi:putative transposase